MSLTHIDDKNFQKEVIEENLPVLVDFYTTWCGPCKIVSPIIEELAEEYKGKFKFAKLNVEEAQAVASKFAVMSVPTFLFFKQGKVVAQIVGALSKKDFKKRIDSFLG